MAALHISMKDIVIVMKLIKTTLANFKEKGFIFSGMSPDNLLPEIVRIN